MTKIFGMSYGLIGDLVMGLPLVKHFRKKYHNPYIYWVIEKKCSMCAPLYFNQPGIDCIRITDEWSGFGDNDRAIMEQCDVVTPHDDWKHSSQYWYNHKNQVEETAYIAGVRNLSSLLTEDEMVPRLYRWFDLGLEGEVPDTYSKDYYPPTIDKKTIAIWPFATAGENTGRSPSIYWWKMLLKALIKEGYTVHHYGRRVDPSLSRLDFTTYKVFTPRSYFEQVKSSLACVLSIGTDSGAMWTTGAYEHPAIHLMTNWLPNHTQNYGSLTPVNKNATTFFAEGGTDNIPVEHVVQKVLEKTQ